MIGLPGETLELRNKKVYVDGQPLDEPYVHFLEPASTSQEVTSFDVRERYGPVKVPAEQYFVMGDNRDNSQDSRYWGFLPRSYIKGKALMIYWSYESGSADYVDSGLGATHQPAVLGRHALLHQDALGAAVPADSLRPHSIRELAFSRATVTSCSAAAVKRAISSPTRAT